MKNVTRIMLAGATTVALFGSAAAYAVVEKNTLFAPVRHRPVAEVVKPAKPKSSRVLVRIVHREITVKKTVVEHRHKQPAPAAPQAVQAALRPRAVSAPSRVQYVVAQGPPPSAAPAAPAPTTRTSGSSHPSPAAQPPKTRTSGSSPTPQPPKTRTSGSSTDGGHGDDAGESQGGGDGGGDD